MISRVASGSQMQIEKYPRGHPENLDANFNEEENFTKTLMLINLIDETLQKQVAH